MHAHAGLVDRVRAALPGDETLYDLAELFKVFGDSTRIKLLSVLMEGEMCVCDLAAALQMSKSAVSHQLRRLRENKLVTARREGKMVFYTIADDHVHLMLKGCIDHATEDADG
jgi:ArsR family transcriptional regulator